MHFPTIRIACLILALIAPGAAMAEEEWESENVNDADVIEGEPLDPADYGPGVLEHMNAVIERDRQQGAGRDVAQEERVGAWVVPSDEAASKAKSGEHNIVNRFGDTHMGIGFNEPVRVDGVYVTGQASRAVWTPAIRAIGFRNDQQVAETDWFDQISDTPTWFDVKLGPVDRIVIQARPKINGAGWYALDDLTFTRHPDDPQRAAKVVLDFEDTNEKQLLSGTDYAGLTWEFGSGEFLDDSWIHAPLVPPGSEAQGPVGPQVPLPVPQGTATTPPLIDDFQGVVRFDAGSSSYPPDTCGAIGPNHFVVAVNRVFAVYNKTTGANMSSVNLGSFLPGSSGDPRVIFDPHSNRWIVIASNFSNRIYLAVSRTSDPLGTWFKTNFLAASGSDAGCWPDFPTLGVNIDGIFVSSYMVGCGMTIWAIDKAPLIAASPSLGTITAFRSLPSTGAYQSAVTFGDPGGEFILSTGGTTSLQVRRIIGEIQTPTLVTEGNVTVPTYFSPPDVPSMGSSVPLDSVGSRLVNAIYRNGSLWTCHTISSGGRAACRWYQINATSLNLVQSGTVSDATLYYFFPSIAVDANGSAVMGFSGAKSSQFAAAYYTGRMSNDPLGLMAPPVVLRAGEASYETIDQYGRNRWGDYSLTTVDPTDDLTLWTIQEFAHAHIGGSSTWGTHIGRLSYGDCNNNGVNDHDDITAGTSEDCNNNHVPDECEYAPELDCDDNGQLDVCDTAPFITGQPASVNLCEGDTAEFSVTVQDPGYSLQWTRNSIPLAEMPPKMSGTTTSTLTITDADPSDEGAYTCLVSLGCLETESDAGMLTIIDPAGVADQPADTLTKCAGEDASFAVTASGGGRFNYEWRHDGAPIAGANDSPVIVLHDVAPSDAGDYTCNITNACGGAESDPGTLVVNGEAYTTFPDDVVVPLGGTAVFHADTTMDNDVEVLWSWRKNGATLANDPPHITGAFTDTLTITGVIPSDEANYAPAIGTLEPELCINVGAAASLTIASDTEPPSVVAAVSRKSHGGAGDYDVDLQAGHSEPRAGGVSLLVVGFNEPIEALDGSLDAGDVSISDGSASIASVTIDGSELTIELSGAADKQCLTFGFSGIADASGNAVTEEVAALLVYADVDDDGSSNASDVAAAKAASSPVPIGSVVDARGDLNLDGVRSVADVTAAMAASSPDVTSCPQALAGSPTGSADSQ